MLCTSEFETSFAVPKEITDLVQAGQLEDISWHNDVCPSFRPTQCTGIRIWVDHADPTERELGADHKRFAVCAYDGEGDFLDDVFATEDLSELLTFLKNQTYP